MKDEAHENKERYGAQDKVVHEVDSCKINDVQRFKAPKENCGKRADCTEAVNNRQTCCH